MESQHRKYVFSKERNLLRSWRGVLSLQEGSDERKEVAKKLALEIDDFYQRESGVALDRNFDHLHIMEVFYEGWKLKKESEGLWDHRDLLNSSHRRDLWADDYLANQKNLTFNKREFHYLVLARREERRAAA